MTVAVGLTVIINVAGVPVHPLAVGVTVIAALTGEVVRFVAVNEGILPGPLVGSPTEALLLVHVKDVPLTGPVKLIADTASPLQ